MRLARAHNLSEVALERHEPFAPIPEELLPLVVARSMPGVSPLEVRSVWSLDDVYDQLMWIEIENIAAEVNRGPQW